MKKGTFVLQTANGETLLSENGKIQVDKNLELFLVATPTLGYEIESIEVNGELLEVTALAGESQTVALGKISSTSSHVLGTSKFNASIKSLL